RRAHRRLPRRAAVQVHGREPPPGRDRCQRRGLQRPRAPRRDAPQTPMSGEHLTSWNDTPTRRAVVEFVERVTEEGGREYVPPAGRIAVFDNDGTLWCEKPMPIELGFILARFVAMAEADESLRDRQPWKAAWEKDYGWLGETITKHYHGDASDVKVL